MHRRKPEIFSIKIFYDFFYVISQPPLVRSTRGGLYWGAQRIWDTRNVKNFRLLIFLWKINYGSSAPAPQRTLWGSFLVISQPSYAGLPSTF